MHAPLAAYLEKEGRAPIVYGSKISRINLEPISGNPDTDIDAVSTFANVLLEQLRHKTLNGAGQFKKRHRLMLGTAGSHYEFREGDVKRIQVLINGLRDLIVASDELQEGHKQRVLKKLVGIVWPEQARAFDLPTNAPFTLPGATDDE